MLRNALTTLAATLSWTVCEAAENTGIAMNDGVELAYWVHGSDDGIPLIVINGQGAAARPEGDGLTTALVAHGFRVILFDNRDSGQSTVLHAVGAPPDWAEIAKALETGAVPSVAYDLSDMAGDTIAVLDAAGVERAHILGHSLGGMIAQVLAARHPDRVLSLIPVSATSGDPDLPYGPAMTAMTKMQPAPSETAADLQARAYRIFEGDASYRMTDVEVTQRVSADMAVDDPNAAARQGAAAGASGDRRHLLNGITTPSLVIHGRNDPWFPITHAESTSAALGNARTLIINGMGHILSDPAAPVVAAHIAEFVRGLSPR